MGKKDKVARKQPEEHKDLDVMTPFSYLDLGSENDPCFGTYELKHKVCKRCGDREACSVVTSQKGFIKQITTENNKNEFLDIQEGELVDKQNGQILKRIEKNVMGNKTKAFSVKKVASKFIEKFNLLPEKDQVYVEQRVIKAAQTSKIIKLTKDLKKYQYGKD